MHTNKSIDQAWRIFSKGRKIHEWVFHLETRYMAGSNIGRSFGELSFAQMRAIKLVKTRGPLSITKLAKALHVSSPSASTMVERLVEKGVLRREPDPADRRKVLVSVSPDMLSTIEQIEKNIFGSFVALVDKVGPEIAENWCRILDRIEEIIDHELQ